MNENLAKHLEFIQDIITRMAGNSFLLKGWTVTLTAGLFTLAAKDYNPAFALVALFPALVFWGLDAFYLRQERLFRKLYNNVITTSSDRSTKVEPFSLDTTNCTKQVPSWFRTLFAAPIFWLHGVVVAIILLIVMVLLVIQLFP